MTKQKKAPTEKQLAARKEFGRQAKARAEAKRAEKIMDTVFTAEANGDLNPEPIVPSEPVTPAEDTEEHIADEQGLDELKAQMKEIMEKNALLTAAFMGQQGDKNNGVNIGRGNKLVGETDKYLVDPAHYPDFTARLAAEGRLQSLAFGHNYELVYRMDVVSYETKTGVNFREPKFHITLNKLVYDGQGERVQALNPKTQKLEDKFYIARRLVFHEDPQAALVVARENGMDVDEDNQKAFLDEMRYIRVRDWLFDIFWPKPSTTQEGLGEEVVQGTIVQVFTRSSEDPGEIPFNEIKTKFSV